MTAQDPAPPPARRPLPPRWLAALSIAIGVVVWYWFFGDLLWFPIPSSGPNANTQILLFGVGLNAGYVIAPFLVGRGLWRSFLAGLVLAPVALGWVMQLWPRLMSDPVLTVLGLVSLAVIVALYSLVFRHLVGEFMSNRRNLGGP
ncbi:MAG: hypothetical protein ACTS3R_19905 [Inquilinaceae bacterium]